MGLREFFADLADLMERHGVDVSGGSDTSGYPELWFTCEDGTEYTARSTLNARHARLLAEEARPAVSFVPVNRAAEPEKE